MDHHTATLVLLAVAGTDGDVVEAPKRISLQTQGVVFFLCRFLMFSFFLRACVLLIVVLGGFLGQELPTVCDPTHCIVMACHEKHRECQTVE